MWLLSTDRAELHYFSSADAVDGGYAILSHTWVGHEQSLQEVQKIAEECKRDGRNPRDVVCSKIRECCRLAERDGYRWVWIDSCCIDKTSSSELSEAINSMFQWYSQAEICYAYLADVPGDPGLNVDDSAFRQSRWHTRGWTLQELIAPAFVIFLSSDWRELGNKAHLAKLIHDVTGVESAVLTRKHSPAQFSMSVRMSWASTRKTTRVEDEAYCLMGLFGVSMPTNYGEGDGAFERLQYEIMRHDPDISLFAFGASISPGPLSEQGVTLYPNRQIYHPTRYLLASSPRQLQERFDFTPDLRPNAIQLYHPLDIGDGSLPPEAGTAPRSPFDTVELPRVSVTSYGVKLRLPVFEAGDVTIVVLLCERRRNHFGLFLQRDPSGKDPIRPRYYVGCGHTRVGDPNTMVVRMANLGDDLSNLRFDGKPIEAKWRTVYVVPRPSDLVFTHSKVGNLTINCNPEPPFRLPHWFVVRLIRLGFDVYDRHQYESTGLRIIYFFHRTDPVPETRLYLGLCDAHPPRPPAHWAKIIPSFDVDCAHDCSEDHIDTWPALSKDFGDENRTIRLSFAYCSRLPQTTRVVHIELFGHVYEKMCEDKRVSFPSLAQLKREKSGGVLPSAGRSAIAGTSRASQDESSSRRARRWCAVKKPLPTLGLAPESVAGPSTSASITSRLVTIKWESTEDSPLHAQVIRDTCPGEWTRSSGTASILRSALMR